MKVAILGGGASGLISAVTMRKQDIITRLFEKEVYLGGIWKFKPNKVLYPSLVTNLPKQIMEYSPEHPFPNNFPSFLTHEHVQAYLEDFAWNHQNILGLNEDGSQVVNLNCEVTKVTKSSDGTWSVSYLKSSGNSKQSEMIVEQFDKVVVCNGHFEVPSIPTLPFQEKFSGRIIHSKQYKLPQTFENETVLVVGARASATDIAREISQFSTAVHIADRNFDRSNNPSIIDKFIFHEEIDKISDDGKVIFKDHVHDTRPGASQTTKDFEPASQREESVHIDTIIWCTGFEYDYPFFESSISPIETELGKFSANRNFCNDISNHSDDSITQKSIDGDFHLEVRMRSVRPLYKQLFHAYDPSLVFIGLPQHVVPFPMFKIQAEAAAHVFTGKVSLPPLEARIEWLNAYEKQLAESGVPLHRYHIMGDDQWDYCRSLAALTGQADEEYLKHLRTNRQIYEDNSAHRPPYVGAPAPYRLREYVVDRFINLHSQYFAPG